MGRWWPAAGLALSVAVYAWDLLKEITIIFISSTIVWPQVNSRELCIQMLLSFLFSFAFASLLFTAICKASPDSHFAFFAFLFYGNGLDPCLLYNVTNLIP